MIVDVSEPSRESREAVEQAMAAANFVLEIQSIESVEQEFDLRNWKVITPPGPRTFPTRLADWPRQLPGGGLLIRDISGDLYCIPQPDQLDQKNRKILWTYAD